MDIVPAWRIRCGRRAASDHLERLSLVGGLARATL